MGDINKDLDILKSIIQEKGSCEEMADCLNCPLDKLCAVADPNSITAQKATALHIMLNDGRCGDISCTWCPFANTTDECTNWANITRSNRMVTALCNITKNLPIKPAKNKKVSSLTPLEQIEQGERCPICKQIFDDGCYCEGAGEYEESEDDDIWSEGEEEEDED